MYKFDVLGVTLEGPDKGLIRVIGARLSYEKAEALSDMASVRRGCEKEFFPVVKSGTYSDGDSYPKPIDTENQ